MPRDGAITLDDIVDQLGALDVACRKCERCGRYRMATLAARYGADGKLPEIIHHLSADCPRRQAFRIHDLCGAYFLSLRDFLAD